MNKYTAIIIRTPKKQINFLPAASIIILFFHFLMIIENAYAISNDQAKIREKPVDTIVLHAIGGPFCQNDRIVFSGSDGDAKKWKKYFEESAVIGIHYIVDRDGGVARSIDEGRIANHANGRNSRSIGIELINNGDGIQNYPSVQIEALINLVQGIMLRHRGVLQKNIVRHSDIDKRTFECNGKTVKQKQDPGPKFPYDEFLTKLKLKKKPDTISGKESYPKNISGSTFRNQPRGEKSSGSIFQSESYGDQKPPFIGGKQWPNQRREEGP